ncbi:MAG: cupin domain-containing protein [Acidobacteriota bacterium]
MTESELLDFAALAALGVLEPDEERQFQTAMAQAGDELRREAARFVEAAALIGQSPAPVAPPARLKQELMTLISAERAKAPRRRVLRPGESPWVDNPQVSGVHVRELAAESEKGYVTLLMRMDPGTVYPAHHHHGSEECYILEGDLSVGPDHYRAGDFLHADGGTDHAANATATGCLLLLVVDRRDYA